MFSHNKRLQYTVRVEECNPGLANLMLEQFGGPQGEMSAESRPPADVREGAYLIERPFPPGKLPGDPRFTRTYFDLSQGEAVPAPGPWNDPARFDVVSRLEDAIAVDGGSGMPSVGLTAEEEELVTAMALRTASDPQADPPAGAELGLGELERNDEL
ncbi:manganese catalase family protein [Xylophilus ampelinus]|uniref:Manganese containing catalase n=1 Tax=Xylophilus ampelinus TaxID=54067 RepID=A0A318T1J2_9BURK|nr:manganese catalase family protein [Xylophilus ampelinus]MCS4508840.1 manganese catalase family protein [Xylophilus ampelinus]PYE79411.1 manganese containing catalase [Xylophilus ampelinus]